MNTAQTPRLLRSAVKVVYVVQSKIRVLMYESSFETQGSRSSVQAKQGLASQGRRRKGPRCKELSLDSLMDKEHVDRNVSHPASTVFELHDERKMATTLTHENAMMFDVH